MILKKFSYHEITGVPIPWYLQDFELGQINLIVGQNATGKSRTLNVLSSFADLISGDRPTIPLTGYYQAVFDDNGKEVKYQLDIDDNCVQKEVFSIDNEEKLSRKQDGFGKLYYEKIGQMIDFQVPNDRLVVVARLDQHQHPFFEEMYSWGKSKRHYYFGSSLGKENLAVFMKKKKDHPDPSIKDAGAVVGFMKRGLDKHSDEFKNKIILEMESIGYDIEDVGVAPVPGLIVNNIPIDETESFVEAVYVKEKDLDGKTYQVHMSQGMFRALSLIIQLNYSQFESLPTCILIDDIGEGLDFERSTKLISLLTENYRDTSIQLVMATNDRFIMNAIPIKYWQVIVRDKNKCKILNYHNSKKSFDEFEFTGLSNFDFLTTEFYKKGFEDQ